MKEKNNTQGKKYLRTWIEIDTRAILQNYKTFRKLIGSKKLLMAVVKSNAYGHGLVDFSGVAERCGIDWFGVDSLVEGVALRKAGIQKPILVLGYTLPERLLEAVKYNLSLTVGDFDLLHAVQSLGKKGVQAKIHIKIDTGMHRQGFVLSEISDVIEIMRMGKYTPILEGIYTHFSSAKDPKFPQVTDAQITVFKEVDMLFQTGGFKNVIRHAGATAGTLIFPQAHFDLARVGIGMYGLWPSEETERAFSSLLKIKPVLSWKTIVSQVKALPKGESIGYAHTETLKRASKIAILPIGYWHGFPRALSSVGYVVIRGKRAKVLGRVSMDMVCVDVTDIPKASIGDEVALIGISGHETISADEIAETCGTINYEIVTRINPLIKRILV